MNTNDALGQRVSQTNANSQTSTITYDVGGRVTARVEPDLSSAWTYDTCTNGIGKICGATSSDGYSRINTYDTQSRPLTTTTTADTTYTNFVSYDTNGRVASQTFPGGVTVNLTYTNLGYLQKVTDASSGTTYWQASTADAEGHITAQTYANGTIVTNNAFDPNTGWLQSSQSGSGSGIVNLSYVDDALGNVKTRQDINQNLTETFIYDNLNRLKSSSVNSTGAGIVTLSYTYDALGNISTRSDVGTYTYGTVNSRPHAVASISGTVNTAFTYDNNGNMTTGNGRTVTYTSFDMPSAISETGASDTFVYGPEHQRIKRQTTAATTIYVNPDGSSGPAYEKDMTSGGATIEERVFVSAGSDPVVMLKRANGTGNFTAYYLYRDSIGSTVAITNSSGTVLEHLAYEPFGKRRASDGASDPTNAIKGVNSDRGFTDHEHLDDIALVHMNGRVFDPLVGRFLSADANIQFADNLQSYNRYSYVSNNPLNARDPTGYFSLKSLFGDFDEAAKNLNSFSNRNDPFRRDATKYLGTHQWALTLVETVAAVATYYCGGCGGAAVQADVTYANTGSLSAGARVGAITWAESYALTNLGGGGRSGGNAAALASFKNYASAVGQKYVEAETQQMLAKVASQNGVSLLAVDVALEAISAMGDQVFGKDRLEAPNAAHPNSVIIRGIRTRGKYGASLPFDIADIALTLQGLPTGTSLDYGANYAGIHIDSHSLGSLDAANIVGWGGTSSAHLYAVPLPMIVPLGPGISITNSLGDIVTGGVLGIITNPSANILHLSLLDHSALDYDPVVFGTK